MNTPSRSVVVDCTHLSYDQIIERIDSFKNLTIHVATPFVTDDKVVLDYFVVKANLAELQTVARENKVSLVFQVPFSGLGTKTSQNKAVLRRFMDSKEVNRQVKSLSKENRKLLSKKHFTTRSEKALGVFRKTAKAPTSSVRLLNLEDEAVQNAHRQVLRHLVSLELTDINITDVSETYCAEVCREVPLTIHRNSLTESTRLVRTNDNLTFAVKVDEDGELDSESVEGLEWVQHNGQTVTERYHNEKTLFTIATTDKGCVLINNHPENKHKSNPHWPKRSFGSVVAGHYQSKDTSFSFDRHGNFKDMVVTPPSTTQLFCKK